MVLLPHIPNIMESPDPVRHIALGLGSGMDGRGPEFYFDGQQISGGELRLVDQTM